MGRATAAKAAAAAAGIGGRASRPPFAEAVDGADVVLTCTASREPLVEAAWLAPGAHVTAVGSDGAGKQELDPEFLRRADVLVVDALEQCVQLGELQHAPELASTRAVELGRICGGERARPHGDAQLTVCDLTGVGVQDVAAANVVLANVPGPRATSSTCEPADRGQPRRAQHLVVQEHRSS